MPLLILYIVPRQTNNKTFKNFMIPSQMNQPAAGEQATTYAAAGQDACDTNRKAFSPGCGVVYVCILQAVNGMLSFDNIQMILIQGPYSSQISGFALGHRQRPSHR